jgi:hypothetical protein
MFECLMYHTRLAIRLQLKSQMAVSKLPVSKGMKARPVLRLLQTAGVRSWYGTASLPDTPGASLPIP